ncbi:MAG: pyridoxamine 5'-phosphate oxidase [Rhodobacteraceae bacterium]|nr:pyridoxamine 5'-phosphate oxidase [Paracoccaceae bacterium]
MNERTGIFSGDDPFEIARRWLDDARAVEVNDPDAAALATVDASGMPNVRIVLMRDIEPGGFIFYTNYTSAKGTEIAATSVAALVLYWKSLHRQIRARGKVEKVSVQQSDAYFNTRPVQSRVGAWASQQSQPLADRDTLMAEVERLSEELGDTPARPCHWGGYRIVPTEMEFWADGAYRLHDRFRWTRQDAAADWTIKRLYP